MQAIHCASPDELIRIETTRRKSGPMVWAAAFFCFLFVSTAQAAVVQAAPVKKAPSCAVAKPAAGSQDKSKPVVKPTVKAKAPSPAKAATAPSSVKTAPGKVNKSAVTRSSKKITPKPLYSKKTIEKAESIAAEIREDLPGDLEREISKFLGMRYRFGAEGQGGYDCSGLIREVYSNLYGINLPRSSSEQSRWSSMQSVPEDDLKTGDLLFFGGGGRGRGVNHVGMYLSGGYFFHAARSEGVTISRIDEAYWKKRFMFSKRVRGLDIGEEGDEEPEDDLDWALRQYSAAFALHREDQPGGVGFLDAGVEIGDTLELVLSGFFLNAIGDDHPAALMDDGRPALSASDLSPAPAEPEKGFQLSAIFSPLEWLKLIPSVTHLDGPQDRGRDREGDDEADRGLQQLGIETWLKLPSSSLALFMAARADNQNDFFSKPLALDPDWDTMDVSLGLNYRISDSLMFSIWGTRSQTVEYKAGEDLNRRSVTTGEDVSFRVNINF